VWVGGFVNDIGDWLLLVALPVYVFTETSSGTATAALFVIELAIAVLLGPVGGSLVDRWDLRRTLIATNVAQAVTLAPLLFVTPDRIWPAFLVAGVQSALTTVNNPAKAALLPRLVTDDQLMVANAAESTSRFLSRLIGSPLGGIAVAAGGLEAVVLIDGATFAAVAIASALVRADTSIAARQVAGQERAGLRAGLRVIRANRPLPSLLSIMGLAAIAQGFFVLLFVVFVVERLDGGGAEIGGIRGVMAVGGILGATTIGRLAHRLEPTTLVIIGLLGMGVTGGVFWNAPSVTTVLWVYFVLFSLAGFPGAALQVGVITTVQRASPPDVLGRAIGALGASEAAGNALGSLIAGFLVDRVRLVALLNVQMGIYLACGLAGLFLLRPRRAVG
jgi:predicted MFS family arabinose efflux permease